MSSETGCFSITKLQRSGTEIASREGQSVHVKKKHDRTIQYLQLVNYVLNLFEYVDMVRNESLQLQRFQCSYFLVLYFSTSYAKQKNQLLHSPSPDQHTLFPINPAIISKETVKLLYRSSQIPFRIASSNTQAVPHIYCILI